MTEDQTEFKKTPDRTYREAIYKAMDVAIPQIVDEPNLEYKYNSDSQSLASELYNLYDASVNRALYLLDPQKTEPTMYYERNYSSADELHPRWTRSATAKLNGGNHLINDAEIGRTSSIQLVCKKYPAAVVKMAAAFVEAVDQQTNQTKNRLQAIDGLILHADKFLHDLGFDEMDSKSGNKYYARVELFFRDEIDHYKSEKHSQN